jgi:pilus assembly protein CpaB
VPVVVAAQSLALGAAVTAEMVATETRPQSAAVDTYGRLEDVVGLVVRRAVAQGEALTTQDFLAAVTVPELVRSIQPGLRAIAVPLSKVDSVGMLLQPGDYVDVILTIDDPDGLNPIVVPNPTSPPASLGATGETAPYTGIDEFLNNTTVKVVVQNVQVLAALPQESEESPETTTNSSKPQEVADVIAVLAVPPQQVEVIRFAEMDGHVSLVLRAPSDYAAGAVTTTGITLRQLVDQYGVLPPLPVTAPAP